MEGQADGRTRALRISIARDISNGEPGVEVVIEDTGPAFRPRCASRFSIRSSRRRKTASDWVCRSSPRSWTTTEARSASRATLGPARASASSCPNHARRSPRRPVDAIPRSRGRVDRAKRHAASILDWSPATDDDSPWTGRVNMRPDKASILIVEDEAKMRRLLELQLAEEGFHCPHRSRRRNRPPAARQGTIRPHRHGFQTARHERPRFSARREAHQRRICPSSS